MATINVSGGGSALQDAINSASDGDTIIVDDGVYSPITFKSGVALTIQSVNGNANCIIDGGHTYDEATDTHTGDNCAVGTSESIHKIIGFTIQNGYNKGVSARVPIRYLTLEDCILQNCYGSQGSCAAHCNLIRCIVQNNHATYKGALLSCSAIDSIIRNNTAGNVCADIFQYPDTEGKKYVNCLIYNDVQPNATIEQGIYHNCTFVNVVVRSYNSSITPQLYNCVLSTGDRVSVVAAIKIMNVIADNDLRTKSTDITEVENSLPNTDPMLDSTYHLKKSSPCIGAGNAEYLQSATDLDGKAWKTPPSIGCYEFYGSKKYLPSSLHPMGI